MDTSYKPTYSSHSSNSYRQPSVTNSYRRGTLASQATRPSTNTYTSHRPSAFRAPIRSVTKVYSRTEDKNLDDFKSSESFYTDSRSASPFLLEETDPDSDYDSDVILWDCPLCMEEVDISDADFTPCECGYQLCRFCWNHIKTVLNDRCPACRRSYSEQTDFLDVQSTSRKDQKKGRGDKGIPRSASPAPGMKSTSAATLSRGGAPIGSILPSRKHLVDIRVLQPNLVYVIGIPLSLECYLGTDSSSSSVSNANTAGIVSTLEVLLASNEYFGKYGNIVKLVINLKGQHLATSLKPPVKSKNMVATTVSAFLTFSHKDEASKAIESIDGTDISGFPLRATYGTTKYCAYFLRGSLCPNISSCLYLHDLGEDGNSYTKEALSARQRDSQLKKTLSNGTEIITHTLSTNKKCPEKAMDDILPHPIELGSSLFSMGESPEGSFTKPTDATLFQHEPFQPLLTHNRLRTAIVVGSGKNSPVLPVTNPFDPLHPSNDICTFTKSDLFDRQSSRFEFAQASTSFTMAPLSFSSDDLNISTLLDTHYSGRSFREEEPIQRTDPLGYFKIFPHDHVDRVETPPGIVKDTLTAKPDDGSSMNNPAHGTRHTNKAPPTYYEEALNREPALLRDRAMMRSTERSYEKIADRYEKISERFDKAAGRVNRDIRSKESVQECKPPAFSHSVSTEQSIDTDKKSRDVKILKKMTPKPAPQAAINPFALLLEDDNNESPEFVEVLPPLELLEVKPKKKQKKPKSKNDIPEDIVMVKKNLKKSFEDAIRMDDEKDSCLNGAVIEADSKAVFGKHGGCPSEFEKAAALFGDFQASMQAKDPAQLAMFLANSYTGSDSDDELVDMSYYGVEGYSDDDSDYEDITDIRDLELELIEAQEETKNIEKKLIQVMQRNRKLVFID